MKNKAIYANPLSLVTVKRYDPCDLAGLTHPIHALLFYTVERLGAIPRRFGFLLSEIIQEIRAENPRYRSSNSNDIFNSFRIQERSVEAHSIDLSDLPWSVVSNAGSRVIAQVHKNPQAFIGRLVVSPACIDELFDVSSIDAPRIRRYLRIITNNLCAFYNLPIDMARWAWLPTEEDDFMISEDTGELVPRDIEDSLEQRHVAAARAATEEDAEAPDEISDDEDLDDGEDFDGDPDIDIDQAQEPEVAENLEDDTVPADTHEDSTHGSEEEHHEDLVADGIDQAIEAIESTQTGQDNSAPAQAEAKAEVLLGVSTSGLDDRILTTTEGHPIVSVSSPDTHEAYYPDVYHPDGAEVGDLDEVIDQLEAQLEAEDVDSDDSPGQKVIHLAVADADKSTCRCKCACGNCVCDCTCTCSKNDGKYGHEFRVSKHDVREELTDILAGVADQINEAITSALDSRFGDFDLRVNDRMTTAAQAAVESALSSDSVIQGLAARIMASKAEFMRKGVGNELSEAPHFFFSQVSVDTFMWRILSELEMNGKASHLLAGINLPVELEHNVKKLCQDNGWSIGQAAHPTFGMVATYPQGALQQALKELIALKQ